MAKGTGGTVPAAAWGGTHARKPTWVAPSESCSRNGQTTPNRRKQHPPADGGLLQSHEPVRRGNPSPFRQIRPWRRRERFNGLGHTPYPPAVAPKTLEPAPLLALAVRTACTQCTYNCAHKRQKPKRNASCGVRTTCTSTRDQKPAISAAGCCRRRVGAGALRAPAPPHDFCGFCRYSPASAPPSDAFDARLPVPARLALASRAVVPALVATGRATRKGSPAPALPWLTARSSRYCVTRK